MRHMNRQPKPPKQPALIKRFLSPNIENLMNLKYSRLATKTERAKALAKDSGIGKNTVIRAIDPLDATSIGIDLVERLAKGLDVMPYQLLIPYLDPNNPQIAHNPTDAEKRLYKGFKGIKQEK